MVKGLFAGVAGLAAAAGVVQIQGDGAAQSSGGPALLAAVPDAGSIATVDAGTAVAQAAAVASDAGAAASPGGGLQVRGSPDGGPLYVGDTPGRLRADPDAGTADGGSGDGGSQASSGRQDDEVRRLRERVAALEAQLARASDNSQTQQLEQLNQQVASLREQLAQERSRREAEEVAAQKARVQEREAVTTLSAAQQQLATGDSRVLDALDSASGSLPAPAQSAVQSARAAVQSGDLAAARYWLSVAISQTQRAQINH